ncbi:hypothetical protein OPV22_007280 [Ensete ventricosum]|uniref:Uncharacterized protein n=1 Tax=Ensete ventricosum TaxID=4639 RepID=A0AAV8RPY1_ENSVE|nr:hypothetical protein OPV22_007280 [Ensete ventricosum]
MSAAVAITTGGILWDEAETQKPSSFLGPDMTGKKNEEMVAVSSTHWCTNRPSPVPCRPLNGEAPPPMFLPVPIGIRCCNAPVEDTALSSFQSHEGSALSLSFLARKSCDLCHASELNSFTAHEKSLQSLLARFDPSCHLDHVCRIANEELRCVLAVSFGAEEKVTASMEVCC